ncbi:MAG: sigma-70 family RNA polymerase sigma factor [Luteitalea sp.]|nr:sigma-70 family RNA polymerase sigma factor [Luteitalea sp.]
MSPRATDSSIELPPLLALESARATDAAGLEEEVLDLFDTFRDSLLRYVCAFGISVSDGEDLVQEVFLALFRHLRGNGGRSNLRGWLFRVAHNLALKRRAQRRREQDRFHADERAAHLVLDPVHNPEEQLTDREQRERAMAVLNALPERDRHCVHLRGSGLRYREIAQVLGISLGGVAKSLTRSIARLQRAIEG